MGEETTRVESARVVGERARQEAAVRCQGGGRRERRETAKKLKDNNT